MTFGGGALSKMIPALPKIPCPFAGGEGGRYDEIKKERRRSNEHKKGHTCPWCDSKEIVIGKQMGYGNVQPNRFMTIKGEPLLHVICKNCGTVIRSYVEHPDNLE